MSYGYKELTIPAGKDAEFKMEPNALHIWPRGQFMLIALPNPDKTFTCTLFFPYKGQESFDTLKSSQDVSEFFQRNFPDVIPLMPSVVDAYFQNPTASLVTITCFPWSKNKTLLLGDSAHAILPFYGQGMNSGFEDCYILDTMMNDFDGDWETLFCQFQDSRKPDADAIAELALQNFMEMRDLVGKEDFLLQKKIEAKLHDLYPSEWLPLYSMVTFSEMPYSEALRKGQKQQRIMDEVITRPGIYDNWESMNFEELIQKFRAS